MTTGDLRDAARYVIGHYRDRDSDVFALVAARVVCAAFLGDHPEDADAKVDAAMLLAKGWRRSGVGQVLMMVDGQPKEVERAVYYDTEEPGDLERLFVRDHEGDTAYIPCGPTVGDLRAACRVLRIGEI